MSSSIKDENIKYTINDMRFYSKIDFPIEVLRETWKEFEWEEAEKKVFLWQQDLTRAAFCKDYELIKKIQNKITSSLEARMLAVRTVSEKIKAAPGIDGKRWRKDEEKMQAAISLNSVEYKSQPLKRIVIQDKRGIKERRIGIPTMNDRAMQVLHAMSLEPIAEAWADRKSFAFRKGRTALDAHACLWNNLCDDTCPEWVLLADVENYYETVSHDWIMRNIPMNKNVLREFLKSGVCFNGEIFPTEEGISLGSSLSPMLGNMILDGLQFKLYDLQGENILDYKDGYLTRFADDFAVTARSKERAEEFKVIVEEFLGERGLRLSEKKTKIVNVRDGFDFLSRHYIKIHNQINVIPSEKAVTNLEKELEDLILNPEKHWTQRSLIQSINSKLHGWATYHRVEESKEIFSHIDVLVNALLLRLMQKTYPNKTIQQLQNKYWYKLPDGRYIFALTTNKNFAVINLSDIILVRHKRMDLKKNIFLDSDYFEEREELQEINKVSGKYKAVWERQNGRCYFCGKPIGKEQEKRIIYKTFTRINRNQDMAYVHEFCKDDDMLYVDTEVVHINNSKLHAILNDIQKAKPNVKRKKWKFRALEDYFRKATISPITLTFSEMEKIIGFKLCGSAYKYTSYWYQSRKGNISDAWENQNYEILKIDLTKKKISFRKTLKKNSKLNIPQEFLTSKIPDGAKYELEEFFKYIVKKYGISGKK